MHRNEERLIGSEGQSPAYAEVIASQELELPDLPMRIIERFTRSKSRPHRGGKKRHQAQCMIHSILR